MNPLMNWSFDDFVKYNQSYDAGAFRGSEATKYDLDAVKTWISIRESLKFTCDEKDMYTGNWKYLAIADRWTMTKYGTNYILIDEDRGLWRTRLTGDEFYHGPKTPYVGKEVA